MRDDEEIRKTACVYGADGPVGTMKGLFLVKCDGLLIEVYLWNLWVACGTALPYFDQISDTDTCAGCL